MTSLLARIAPGVMILAIVLAIEYAHSRTIALARAKLRGVKPYEC